MEAIDLGNLDDVIDLGNLDAKPDPLKGSGVQYDIKTKRPIFRDRDAMSKSNEYKSAKPSAKKRMVAEQLDKESGYNPTEADSYSAALQREQYEPEGLGKSLLRGAIRHGIPGAVGLGTAIATGTGPAGGAAGYAAASIPARKFEQELLGPEPVAPPQERVTKGGTFGEGLNEMVGNIPRSIASTVEGLSAMPFGVNQAVEQSAMEGSAAPVKTMAKDMVTGIGDTLFLNGADAALDKWVKDPAMAAVDLGMVYGVAKGVKSGVKSILPKEDVNVKVDKAIEKKYPYAFAMKTKGIRNNADYVKRLDNAKGAIKTIVEMKGAGELSITTPEGTRVNKLPETRQEASEAIYQAQGKIFEEYNAMQQAAGQKGVTVTLEPLVKELDTISQNPVLNDLKPDVAGYARQRAEALSARGEYTPADAQNAIKIANESYDAFLKNPSLDTAGKATVDALTANILRRELDNVISSVEGEGYGALKKKYGQLSAIRDDIVKSAAVDARRSPIGLLDFTDMFSAGEAISGLISLNPAMMAKGGTMFAIKRMYKHLKDPNTAVKSMFEATDKYYKRPVKPFVMPEANLPGEQKLLPPGQGFTTKPYYGEVIPPEQPGIIPEARRLEHVIQGETVPQAALPSPGRTADVSPIEAGYIPVNKPGGAAERIVTNEGPQSHINMSRGSVGTKRNGERIGYRVDMPNLSKFDDTPVTYIFPTRKMAERWAEMEGGSVYQVAYKPGKRIKLPLNAKKSGESSAALNQNPERVAEYKRQGINSIIGVGPDGRPAEHAIFGRDNIRILREL